MAGTTTSQRRADLDTHKTLDKNDARQAVTTGRIRYVLAISLAFCAVAFAFFYLFFIP